MKDLAASVRSLLGQNALICHDLGIDDAECPCLWRPEEFYGNRDDILQNRPNEVVIVLEAVPRSVQLRHAL